MAWVVGWCCCSGLSDEEVSKVAGCDLLNEAPEIRNWLLEETKGKDVVVGGETASQPEAGSRSRRGAEAWCGV